MTPEHRANISKGLKGKKQSPEHIEKNRLCHTGIKHTEEAKQKMRGRVWSYETRMNSTCENHHNWKGDKVKYRSLHKWVRKYSIQPSLCEICKFNPPYDISNISGKYTRKLSDWQWLCRSCHRLYDYIKNGKT